MTNILYIIFILITVLIINGVAILFKIRNLLENYDMISPEYFSQINLTTLFSDKQKIIPQDEFSNEEIPKVRKLIIREVALVVVLIILLFIQFGSL